MADPAAAAAATSASSRRPLQDYRLMHNFLTQPLWNALLNPELRESQRADALFERVFALGLRCPSEPTMGVMAGLVSLTQQHTAFQSHALLATVKVQWKSFLKRKSEILRLVGDQTVYLSVLPQNWITLSGPHRELFEATGPAPCPIADADLLARTLSIPLRRSNSSAPSAVRPQAALQNQDPTSAWMAGASAVVSMLTNRSSAGEPSSGSARGDIPIEYLPSQRSRDLLGLQPAPSTQAPGLQQAERTRQLQGSQLQTFDQPTERGSSSAQRPSALLSLLDAVSEGPQLPANDGADGIQLGLQQTPPGLALQQLALPDLSSAHGIGNPDQQPASQLPPATEMRELLEQELGQRQPQKVLRKPASTASVLVRPAAARPSVERAKQDKQAKQLQKKPAAKLACKRPAADGTQKSSAKRPFLEKRKQKHLDAGVPASEIEAWAGGCEKCRHQACGCSLSCFRARGLDV